MRFGLISLSSSPSKMLEAATVSEHLGYDALYAADHLFAYFAADWPFLNGWATLGAWVQNTTKIRLGPFLGSRLTPNVLEFMPGASETSFEGREGRAFSSLPTHRALGLLDPPF